MERWLVELLWEHPHYEGLRLNMRSPIRTAMSHLSAKVPLRHWLIYAGRMAPQVRYWLWRRGERIPKAVDGKRLIYPHFDALHVVYSSRIGILPFGYY